MIVIGVRHKPMNVAKKLMVFRPPFGLNNDYGGNFKGGVPPLMRGSICGFFLPRPHALVPVSKFVEVVLHVGKGAKFGVEKAKINRVANVGNGKNFKKQAQCSKG